MYACNFGTGSRWLRGVIQVISGHSYLVKLASRCPITHHQGHMRCRLTSADGEQSTETQQVSEVQEGFVPVAFNEAFT